MIQERIDTLRIPLIESACTRFRHSLKTVKYLTDRPIVHTKTDIFCRQILKAVDFESGALTCKFCKQHRLNNQKPRNQSGTFGTRLIDS